MEQGADANVGRGIDVPIYVSYFRKSERKYMMDAPVRYSEPVAELRTKEALAKRLCERCNEPGA